MLRKNNWPQSLAHSFFAFFIEEMFNDCENDWPAHFEWLYQRFHNVDQYWETLPDLIGTYCMGGEL